MSRKQPNQPKRGFAAMSPEQLHRIALLCGTTFHAADHDQHLTPEDAQAVRWRRTLNTHKVSAPPAAPVTAAAMCAVTN